MNVCILCGWVARILGLDPKHCRIVPKIWELSLLASNITIFHTLIFQIKLQTSYTIVGYVNLSPPIQQNFHYNIFTEVRSSSSFSWSDKSPTPLLSFLFIIPDKCISFPGNNEAFKPIWSILLHTLIANERQHWTNCVNNEYECSIIEAVFVLNIQIFDFNIWLLVMSKSLFGVTKMVYKSRNHVFTASRNFPYFTLKSNNRKE